MSETQHRRAISRELHFDHSSSRRRHETVQVTKQFIDAELARYETWDEVEGAKHSTLTSLCGSSQGFAQAKTSGAGRKMICAFLGGNWKPWQVEDALKALKDDTVDREAVERLPMPSYACLCRNSLHCNDLR